jgi:hypothetical protein
LSRKDYRSGESRRRGGPGWRNSLFLWALILAAAGLIFIVPHAGSVLALAGIHLAAVAIHEGGHYLAAVRLRYRVSSVRIGPLEITPGYRGWRMELVKVALDGHVEALPPDHRYAPGREALFAAAGPVANFAAIIVLHGLSLLIAMLPAEGVAMSARDLVGGFTEGLALWSGGCGVFNLIPFRTRRYPSDGAQLLDIVRRSRSIGRRY